MLRQGQDHHINVCQLLWAVDVLDPEKNTHSTGEINY